MKPCIYVIANKGLDMSHGKLAAQVGHAVAGVMMISQPRMITDWTAALHRWMLVLEAQDEAHLMQISSYLADRSIECHRVIDEGVNEVRPISFTALGVEILDKDSPQAACLQGLPRYSRASTLTPIPVDWLSRKGRKRYYGPA